jgi:hypothetical protein
VCRVELGRLCGFVGSVSLELCQDMLCGCGYKLCGVWLSGVICESDVIWVGVGEKPVPHSEEAVLTLRSFKSLLAVLTDTTTSMLVFSGQWALLAGFVTCEGR